VQISNGVKAVIKKKSIRRLKIIEGQIRGLQKMVHDEKYCVDIITQSLAIKQALSGVEDLLLENHLSTHVSDQMKKGEKTNLIYSRKDSKDTLFLGFELEVECNPNFKQSGIAVDCLKLYKPQNVIYVKNDSSLDYGFEVVAHPHTLAAHGDRKYNEMLSFLEEKKCKSHDTRTCGLHVHVNRSFFARSDMPKLAMLIYNNWEYIKKVSRRESAYARKKETNNGKEIKNVINGDDRREAVNFQNKKTIEFRMFRGTLKFETFMASLEIVDAWCKFIKTVNIMQLRAGADSWKLFVEWVRKQNYTHLLKYLEEKKCV